MCEEGKIQKRKMVTKNTKLRKEKAEEIYGNQEKQKGGSSRKTRRWIQENRLKRIKKTTTKNEEETLKLTRKRKDVRIKEIRRNKGKEDTKSW